MFCAFPSFSSYVLNDGRQRSRARASWWSGRYQRSELTTTTCPIPSMVFEWRISFANFLLGYRYDFYKGPHRGGFFTYLFLYKRNPSSSCSFNLLQFFFPLKIQPHSFAVQVVFSNDEQFVLWVSHRKFLLLGRPSDGHT